MPPDSNAAFGPEAFAAASGVSRETLARLKLYASILEDWNSRHNLVSAASLTEVWRRHFWDSAQLVRLIPPETRSMVDLGSGAGFPGLVLAELLRDRPMRIVLYESTAKKCRFLEEVANRLDLTVEIRQSRIEDAEPEPFDAIVARACAPLPLLLAYAQRFWHKNSIGLFLKGQNVEAELTESHKSWRMNLKRHQSLSDPSGIIVEIRELKRATRERDEPRR